MPMLHFPVTLPYTLAGDPAGTRNSVRVEAVAATSREAAASAVTLAVEFVRMRHPGRVAQVQIDSVVVGAAGAPVAGMFAYVLTSRFSIAHLAFAPRLDRDAARQVLSTLNDLETRSLYGVIADCTQLVEIADEGIAVFRVIAPRVRLRLVRPTPVIQRALDAGGVAQVAPSFPDLAAAAGDLAAKWMQIAATNVV